MSLSQIGSQILLTVCALSFEVEVVYRYVLRVSRTGGSIELDFGCFQSCEEITRFHSLAQ